MTSWRRLLRLGRAALNPDRLWFYVTFAAGFVALGTLIDTIIGPPSLLVFVEELCEMAAAMSLLFAAFAGLLHKRDAASVQPETA